MTTMTNATPSSTYFERLAARCAATGASLCVGLDPDLKRLPRHLGQGGEAVLKFCVEIIAATAEHAAAFKPNIAFFESLGVEGWGVLAEALKAVPAEVPVLLDAKRGDIGSTAEHYARAIFDQLGADAVTVNPYMGIDSVEPWLKYENKGVYLLCLTSNPGAADFQLEHDLYLSVARKVAGWNTRGNCGMVVGATKPQYLAAIGAAAPGVPLLIPGLGAQGGDLAATLAAAPGRPLHHLLFNVSRAVTYVTNDESYAEQARAAAKQYRDMIHQAYEQAGEKQA